MYTDFAGQPINEGDNVVIPIAKFRTQRAGPVLLKTQVERLVALVPDPYMPGNNYLVREDEAHQARGRHYAPCAPDKAYVAVVTYVSGNQRRASVEPRALIVVP